MGETDRQRLSDAVESLYRVFSAPTPPVIEGCPCCIETRGVDVLLATPLRDLTGQALWRYVTGAFYTVGGERDFRYFLPRILDISVNDPREANDPEIVLRKLALAGWQAWAPDERWAIEAFVDAWFEQAVREDLASLQEDWISESTESVLCGAARAGMSISPLLDRLNEPAAAPVLDHLRDRFGEDLSGFWEDAPQGVEEIRAFLARNPA